MKNLWLLAALICFSVAGNAQLPITKIFVVRHADRQGSDDALTDDGRTRASVLARTLAPADIDSIYSTDFIRTRKTAEPLSKAIRRPIRIYSDIPQLIGSVRGSGKRMLVVGHSNTVDDIIRECGCKAPAAITPEMPSTQYDNLFLVLIHSDNGIRRKCELVHMKYGAVTK